MKRSKQCTTRPASPSQSLNNNLTHKRKLDELQGQLTTLKTRVDAIADVLKLVENATNSQDALADSTAALTKKKKVRDAMCNLTTADCKKVLQILGIDVKAGGCVALSLKDVSDEKCHSLWEFLVERKPINEVLYNLKRGNNNPHTQVEHNNNNNNNNNNESKDYSSNVTQAPIGGEVLEFLQNKELESRLKPSPSE